KHCGRSHWWGEPARWNWRRRPRNPRFGIHHDDVERNESAARRRLYSADSAGRDHYRGHLPRSHSHNTELNVAVAPGGKELPPPDIRNGGEVSVGASPVSSTVLRLAASRASRERR